MYAVINVWVDVISFIIFFALAGGILLWFAGYVSLQPRENSLLPRPSISSSRFTERFIRKHWSFMDHLHEPLINEFPLPTTFWHWVNLISWFTLLISGYYIRYPFFVGGMDIMKKLHFFFMYVIVINFLWRVTYTILNPNDRRHWKFSRKEIKLLWQVPMYYLFMRPEYEHVSKFHPIQRGTYYLLAAQMVLQAFTGFAMMWPQAMLGGISGFFGGVAAAGAWMRWIHSINMRVFVYNIMLHAYLAIVETWPKLRVFWFRISPLPASKGALMSHGGEAITHEGEVVKENISRGRGGRPKKP